MKTRRRISQSLLVIMIGFVALVQPLSSRAEEAPDEEDEGGCSWCRTECPVDYQAYCENKGCPTGNPECLHVVCNPLSHDPLPYKMRCNSAN